MKRKYIYAGFWVRSVASLIDILVLLLPSIIIEQLLGESIVSIFFTLVLWWFYTTMMLSSSWEATVGKRVVGIYVTDYNHETLSFKEASIRSLLSLISYALLLPILLMLFTDKKQTFHDYYAKTIVLDKIAIDTKHSYTGIKTIRAIGILVVLGILAGYIYTIGILLMLYIAVGS